MLNDFESITDAKVNPTTGNDFFSFSSESFAQMRETRPNLSHLCTFLTSVQHRFGRLFVRSGRIE
jgi:hypothetical protein